MSPPARLTGAVSPGRTFWREGERALALLELWAAGRLRLRRQQQREAEELLALGYARRTRRRDELALVEPHRAALAEMLDHAWPAWRAEEQALRAAGLPLDLHGLHALQDLRRAQALPAALPAQLNRRTAAAAVAHSSKAGLSADHRATLGPVTLTQDGVLRLRPAAGLWLERGVERHDACALAALCGGEVLVPERALRAGLILSGSLPRAVLLVENLGVYIDLLLPPGWAALHVPGWDSTAARRLPELLRRAPLIHFGDLDPEGVKIHHHLRALLPGLRWLVPDFWEDYIEVYGQEGRWPPDLALADAPSLVRELARRDRWLEQECLVLDPRLPAALEALASGSPTGGGRCPTSRSCG